MSQTQQKTLHLGHFWDQVDVKKKGKKGAIVGILKLKHELHTSE